MWDRIAEPQYLLPPGGEANRHIPVVPAVVAITNAADAA
jgi:hypothetical protein